VIRLTRIGGVPVKVHWSFSLLFLLVIYLAYVKNLAMDQLLSFGVMILILFACVLLHELGHTLMAKRLGIRATDIVLSPIGGLARLESMHAYPKKEIAISLAGPFVNLILALLLFILLYVVLEPGIDFDPYNAVGSIAWPALLYYMLFINLMLFVLNLIPAFPMDGGRILRALLSLRMDVLKATHIAVITGRIFAVLFMILAIYFRYYALIIVSLFIYIMATAEYRNLLESHAMDRDASL